MSADLTGKTAVITGGNSGIGKETAVELARMGAHVVIAARNPVKAAAAVKEVQDRTHAGDRVETMPIDLASFASVRSFADAFTQRHDRCDILVNNAGVVLRKRQVTIDGHEMQFQVNHLGHFLLTHLLRDTLERSAPARIVNVASEAHRMPRRAFDLDDLEWERRRYRSFSAYSATKVANILFTRELAERWDGHGITANAVHPGFVGSNFAREGDMGRLLSIGMVLSKPISLSPRKGAITSVYVASSPEVDGISGQYFSKCQVIVPAAAALDATNAQRLWEISEKLTAAS